MSKLLSIALAVCVMGGVAQAGPGFDDAFWGEPIATFSTDTTNVPAAFISTRADTYYAQLPQALVAQWVANPSSNYGIAAIGQAPNYYTNACWATYNRTWQWDAAPHLRMDGWNRRAEPSQGGQMAFIREQAYDFRSTPSSPAAGQSADGSQFCLGNGHNVVLIKFGNLSGGVTDPWIRWSATWKDGGMEPLNVYVVPVEWSEATVTYGNLIPEPASLAVLALGGLALLRRRR